MNWCFSYIIKYTATLANLCVTNEIHVQVSVQIQDVSIGANQYEDSACGHHGNGEVLGVSLSALHVE